LQNKPASSVFSRIVIPAVIAAIAAGCVTSQRAPVLERGKPPPQATPKKKQSPPVAEKRESETAKVPEPPSQQKPSTTARPEFHVVQKGETLFSIARLYNISHYELGLWNGLDNVNAIREGQQLRLNAPADGAPQISVSPLKGESQGPVGRPIQEEAPAATSTPAPIPEPAAELKAPEIPSTGEPKAVKVPYTDEAWTRYRSAPDVVTAKTEPANTETQPADAKLEKKTDVAAVDPSAGVPKDHESLQWVWPATGKIASTFSEATKGLTIAGTLGQPVLAGADGQVSYIGNSLRGYGKMVVIKHNKTYLSVYAHNSAILVREGQTVTRGQKIAEMGNSDSDDGSVKLHFEIRRLGKPVDPMRYLPSEKRS
jgi:lipoprotein NlpD